MENPFSAAFPESFLHGPGIYAIIKSASSSILQFQPAQPLPENTEKFHPFRSNCDINNLSIATKRG